MRHLLLAILLVIPIAAATQDTCPHGCQPTEDRTKVQEEQRAQGWTTAHSAESEHWRGVYHHLRKGTSSLQSSCAMLRYVALAV